jgi:hypothetical protein
VGFAPGGDYVLRIRDEGEVAGYVSIASLMRRAELTSFSPTPPTRGRASGNTYGVTVNVVRR